MGAIDGAPGAGCGPWPKGPWLSFPTDGSMIDEKTQEKENGIGKEKNEVKGDINCCKNQINIKFCEN